MTNFDETQWSDNEFSQNYRDDANIYLPYRHQFIEITKSLYAHFIDSRCEARILDLGCGDGLFVQELLKTFSPANVTLVDGSSEMLEAAQKRLHKKRNTTFIKTSFQELLAGKSVNESYDFIYSSLAIHHLKFTEKKLLYSYIYKLLSSGGCFVHYDVVVPQSQIIEPWYLSLWEKWIKEHPDKEMGEKLIGIPRQYKENDDNIPDTLESQLEALKEIGFQKVDCYFKYGIFCLFGGFKK